MNRLTMSKTVFTFLVADTYVHTYTDYSHNTQVQETLLAVYNIRTIYCMYIL